MRLSRYGYNVTVLGEMVTFSPMKELWRDSKRTFLKIPLQLPELKEQTDSYNVIDHGRNYDGRGRQQDGGTNGFGHYNSHSRH